MTRDLSAKGAGDVRRVLVAARGPAASRLVRSVHDAGLEAVVLLRPDDEIGDWIDRGDYSVVVPAGPLGWPDRLAVPPSAVDAGCDAVLPGWDCLARDADTAELCMRHGLTWLGCPVDQLALMTDRASVRRHAQELGLSVVPGMGPVTELMTALAWAASVGFPIALKPAVGHVRPLVRVDTLEELTVAATGMLEDGPVMVERFVLGAREIEVPLVGDGEEAVVAVGTRDVTGRIGGQRRVWIGPAGGLEPALEEEMMYAALALASSIEWRGVGAARFLLTSDGRPYLLDLNPGLRGADVVTERIYGVDLVDAALRVGMGQRLQWGVDEVSADGVAIGVRICVSQTGHGSAHVAALGSGSVHKPDSIWLPVADGERIYPGDDLGQLVVQAPGRQAALVQAKVALDQLDVGDLPCALPGLRRILADQGLWTSRLDREEFRKIAGADPER